MVVLGGAMPAGNIQQPPASARLQTAYGTRRGSTMPGVHPGDKCPAANCRGTTSRPLKRKRSASSYETSVLPADVILLEQNSRNTRENALYTAKLLNEHGIRACAAGHLGFAHAPRTGELPVAGCRRGTGCNRFQK
ncbi:MAG: hypothetical protein KIS75_13695 [Chromatiales bacterium]|nr:hypothetical protein [Chromatiales bacterium]